MSDWTPSPDDVGALLRTRTNNSFGVKLGTFDSDTEPTGDQVLDIIDTVVSDIHAEVGDIPDSIQDQARRVAALGAACLVELSFYPEQVKTGRSVYDELTAWYEKAFARMKMQVNDARDDGVINDADETLPAFSFPEADPCDPNALVGWNSRF